MRFSRQLSSSLVVLRALLCAAAVLPVLSCQDTETLETLGPSSDSVSRGRLRRAMRITPDSLTLETAQQAQFKAYAISSNGDSVPIRVEWKVTGGRITSSGNFTAGAPGAYKVIGRIGRSRGWRRVADTAVVDVVPTAPTIIEVVVSPDTATVAVGASRTFSAVGMLSGGLTQPIGVTWSATGGSIDPAGNYTAGETPGDYRVVAAHAAAALADTAAVTISADPPGPPGPPAPPPLPPPAPVATQVVLVPGSASLQTGASQQFAAYGRTASGDSIGLTVAYAATGGTITTAGKYTAGSTAGSYRVIATQTGGTLADTSQVTLTAPPPAPPPPTPPPPPQAHAGWQVAPNGSSSGAGTQASPWSLGHAASGAGGKIQPGDTVWVRGGTYGGDYAFRSGGNSTRPVIYRAYPGEQPVVTGEVEFPAGGGPGYVWLWGFEHRNGSGIGLDVRQPGVKLINCLVHDRPDQGIGFWAEAHDAEIAGCIVYNNGQEYTGQAASPDHGIYFQNQTGTKLFRDNVVFGNCDHGFHGFASNNDNKLTNFTFSGNVTFLNASCGPGRDFLVGGASAVRNLRIDHLYSYDTRGETSISLGYIYGPTNVDVHVSDAYLVGGPPLEIVRFPTVDTLRVVKRTAPVGSAPANQVFVIRNPYEPRATVVVYNWSNVGSVTADVSGSLTVGRPYEVLSVLRMTGAPVATGIYGGGSITIPMTAIPSPPGAGNRRTIPALGTQFGVFVARSK